MDTNTSRVETTLFLLMSVDGKITSGESDNLDSDRDWKRIRGVREGLQQYYRHERNIAANSLNTGRVMAKIGLNTRPERPEKNEGLTFFIVDRKPHLNPNGVEYLAQWVGMLFVVTDNPGHPALDLRSRYKNIQVLFYKGGVDFSDLFVRIRQEFGIRHLVVESGGTLNTVLVRQGLIDHVCVSFNHRHCISNSPGVFEAAPQSSVQFFQPPMSGCLILRVHVRRQKRACAVGRVLVIVPILLCPEVERHCKLIG